MKIGFVLKDIGLSEIDMRCPEKGNPGVGGSEFLFLLLMMYIKIYDSSIGIICYHFGSNTLMEEIEEKIVKTVYEVPALAEEAGIDYLIYQINWGKKWYEELLKHSIKTIAWAHCYVSKEELKYMVDCKNVKRVVFVGKEQYDTYIDHAIIEKSTYIYNMIPISGKEKRNTQPSQIVTYVGSITRGKGFHILAREWKHILKAVPNAELYVAGSGKLYDRRSKLGKYGIAEENYEAEFIKYLTDEAGNILDSVHFLGIVGEEKAELYQKTKVGIINPSAKTETFGMSAVEMSAYGIPIATKGQYGLYDTVLHKRTGLLSHTHRGFRNHVIKLLKDSKYNEQLGLQGKHFVSEAFTPEKIVPQWIVLFLTLEDEKQPVYQLPTAHYFNDFKWLRICNRTLKRILRLKNFPAVCDVKRTY